MCPIAHPPRYPISIFNTHDTPLPMCPITHVSCCTYQKRCQVVEKMSSCQKYVKLSKRCQMSKSQTHRLWRRFTKKINSHNEVHTYWRQFWCQIWRSSKLFKNTFYGHFEGFWSPSYVTSKLTSICVNLIMSIYFFLWTSSIVHVFDFLTFDIFLTTWHLFDSLTSFWQLDIFLICATGHMGNGTHGQRGIMCNIKDTDGVPWAMGRMGNWAHDHNVGKWVSWLILKIEMWHLGRWGTWVMGHMVNVVMCLIMCHFLNTAWIFIKILLHIDIDVFYLNIQWYSRDGPFKYWFSDWFQHWFHELVPLVPMISYGTCPISLLSVGLSLRFFYWR